LPSSTVGGTVQILDAIVIVIVIIVQNWFAVIDYFEYLWIK